VARLAAERVGPDGAVEGLDPNPGMLEVAREAAGADHGIAWHQAPAENMPCPDAHFDVVLCSMGLQFFADRVAGLREMRRVLAPGGRMLASLPGPTPPPLQAMAESLARYVNPEVASFVHAVFALHDADEIEALATEAGFERVETRSAPMALELPPPAEFLWQYVYSTPLAGPMGQLDTQRRETLERDFVERCRVHARDNGISGGVRMTTLTARR
jgi:ubiquinone/menaquinone biosynthesis C-methylase UbiE